MLKIKINPSYVAMTQHPYCCVPTCVQMSLHRRGLSILEQEEIGIDLGLMVPPEEVNNFKNVPTGKMSPSGWGTRINIKKYSLNNFLKKRNLPLTSEYQSLDDIKNVSEYIATNLSCGNDLLVCFRYGALYNKNIPFGHGSLIEEINGNSVMLVDPRPDLKRKTVSINDLIRSIKEHHKGNAQLGGFWSIEST